MFPEHSAFYNLDRHCHIKHSRAVVNVMLAINLRDSKKKKERERNEKEMEFGFVSFWHHFHCHCYLASIP